MATASFDAQFLNIPIRALYISGSLFPMVVREATLSRGVNVHDAGTMSVMIMGDLTFDGNLRIPVDSLDPTGGTRVIDVQSLTGQPIFFTYGITPQVESFFGYILSVTPDQKFKQGLNYVIQVVASTLVMQQVVRRFYTNITSADFISQCCSRVQLGFDGRQFNGYHWPSIGVTDQTDWTMSVAMAMLNGSALFSWAGVVRMVNPLEMFKQYPYTKLTSSDDLLETDRKLMDFKPTEQAAGQLAVAPRRFYFFDDRGTVVNYKQPSDLGNPRYNPYSDRPVRSRQEAEVLAAASASDMGRWLHSATARIKGDSSIYPGLTVEVFSGAKDATVRFNGRWLVRDVQHSMTREAYNTELTLVRPGNTVPAISKASFEHFWRASEKPRPGLALRNGQWTSSWASPYTEAA